MLTALPISAPLLAAFAAAGLLAGLTHYTTMRATARMWMEDRRLSALALKSLRLAVAVALFMVAAHKGPWPMLCACIGFLLARALLLRPAPVRLGRPAE